MIVKNIDDSIGAFVRQAAAVALACASLALWGCAGANEAPGVHSVSTDSVTVVFTKEEEPFPVRRPVAEGTVPLRAALEWLVQGPSPEERAAGIRSWFSDTTAGALRSVEVDSTGRAVVDFHDLRPLIPNASTSFGSKMLLQELNGTVFQFPEIRSAEYRMEGSCDLFWDWLQYGCQIVTPAGGN